MDGCADRMEEGGWWHGEMGDAPLSLSDVSDWKTAMKSSRYFAVISLTINSNRAHALSYGVHVYLDG